MSCPGPDLLLEHACELLDAPEAERLGAHLVACADCHAQRERLTGALAAPPAPPPPAEVLEALHRRIDEHEGRDQPAVPGEEALVRLHCTYCKDDLPKAEAVFCAGCLAPHHTDCFAEHGRCSIAGCESTTTVQGTEVVPKPKRRKLKAGLILLLSAVGGGALVAALEAEHAATHRRPRAAIPSSDPNYRTETYDVAALVGAPPKQSPRVRRAMALLERPAPPSLGEATLQAVLDRLRREAGLKLVVDGEARERLERKVLVTGSNLSVGVYLGAALEQAGCRLHYQGDAFRVRLNGGRAGGVLIDITQPGAQAARLDPEGLLLLVRGLCGPAWAAPAAITLEGGQLRVTQTEAHQRTVRGLLRDLHRGEAPPQPGPWSYPAVQSLAAPATAGPERWSARLGSTAVTLNLRNQRWELSRVLSALQKAGLRVDMTSRAARLIARAKLETPLRGAFTAEAALRTACGLLTPQAVQDRLRWEPSADGVRFRDLAEPSLLEQLRCPPGRARFERQLRRDVDLRLEGDLATALTQLSQVSGVPFAASRDTRVRATTPFDVTLRGPLDEQLDGLLAERELGLELRERAVWIVPRSQANHDPVRVASFLDQPAHGSPQAGVPLAALVERLGLVGCRLDERAQASRARLLLPARTTRRELLELAWLQAGVEASVRFVGRTALISLFGSEAAPLTAAHRLHEELPAYDRLRAPLQRRGAGLFRRFRAALGAVGELHPTHTAARACDALLTLANLRRQVEELLEVDRALDPEGLAAARRTRTSRLFAHQSRWNEVVEPPPAAPRPQTVFGLSTAPEEVTDLELEEAAAEVGVREALARMSRRLGRRKGWERAFPDGFRAWRSAREAEVKRQVRRGLARQRSLGLAFRLTNTRSAPVIFGLLPARDAARGGVRKGEMVRWVSGRRVDTLWDLVFELGRLETPRFSMTLQAQRGPRRVWFGRKPQGSEPSRR